MKTAMRWSLAPVLVAVLMASGGCTSVPEGTMVPMRPDGLDLGEKYDVVMEKMKAASGDRAHVAQGSAHGAEVRMSYCISDAQTWDDVRFPDMSLHQWRRLFEEMAQVGREKQQKHDKMFVGTDDRYAGLFVFGKQHGLDRALAGSSAGLGAYMGTFIESEYLSQKALFDKGRYNCVTATARGSEWQFVPVMDKGHKRIYVKCWGQSDMKVGLGTPPQYTCYLLFGEDGRFIRISVEPMPEFNTVF